MCFRLSVKEGRTRSTTSIENFARWRGAQRKWKLHYLLLILTACSGSVKYDIQGYYDILTDGLELASTRSMLVADFYAVYSVITREDNIQPVTEVKGTWSCTRFVSLKAAVLCQRQ